MHALPLHVTAYTAVCAAGSGRRALLQSLESRTSGLRPNDFTTPRLATWIGRVAGLEHEPLARELKHWDCRNNRLAARALAADDFSHHVARARGHYGAARIALVLGTSTASVGATEEAYGRLEPDGRIPLDLQRPIIHAPHSLGDFVQRALALRGPCITVATACASSAKVFAQAERLIRLGIVDAAVVGGTDTLCGTVLFGFNSLALVSSEPCRPFDSARNGLSLGEAAGFALLEREGEGPWLIGHGESSDAHHMSAPHPLGAGARRAIGAALASARIAAEDVDYINLHGTASRKNDEIEASVVAEMFPRDCFAGATKGWTGHTLGAAGILEAVITLLALESGLAPGTVNSTLLDPVCGPQIRLQNERRALRYALSHSFGFGGSNCVLAFAASDAGHPALSEGAAR